MMDHQLYLAAILQHINNITTGRMFGHLARLRTVHGPTLIASNHTMLPCYRHQVYDTAHS